MSENDEEQLMELEALESIYDAEYALKSGEAGADDELPRRVELTLWPEREGEGGENHVGVLMVVEMPPSYPSTDPPMITLTNIKDLPDSQMDAMRAIVDEAVTENVGEALVFTVGEAVKEWLVDNNVKHLDAHESMMQRREQAEKRKARRIARGGASDDDDDDADDDDYLDDDDDDAAASDDDDDDTGGGADWVRLTEYKSDVEPSTLVTADNFKQWLSTFEERQAGGAAALAAIEEAEKKLTGKQLFVQNLVKSMEKSGVSTAGGDDAANGAAADGADGQVFFYNEDIYDDDDDDLPDDDDDDDE